MVKGKTILVTGAANGLGRAWCKGFLADGGTVIAADIDTEGLVDLAEQGAITCETDVANERDVQNLIGLAIGRTGRIDALFNNAGIGWLKPFLDVPGGEFEKHIDIHLHGTVYGMRYALPHMVDQGYGRIINTLSRAAEIATGKGAAYAAAKAAIWAATVSVAKEYRDSDILINMLIPGPTNTAIWGQDMPEMQSPDVTYPTAKMLATLPAGSSTGKVFWDEKEYPLFKSLYAEF